MEGQSFCEFSHMILPQWNLSNCLFNVPGSAPDSQIVDWGNAHVKLEEVYNNYGGISVVDFTFGKVRRPYVMKSCQDPCSLKKLQILKQLTRYT